VAGVHAATRSPHMVVTWADVIIGRRNLRAVAARRRARLGRRARPGRAPD
jgi:hypothetical protein